MSRADIESLIPHRGAMCLLERVCDWDQAQVRLATATHRDPANPLRRDGHLAALHLCEYGAQAMAVHGGLTARAEGRQAPPGFLVSLRSVSLHCEHVEDLSGELEVVAERLQATPTTWQYAFRVSHEGRVLAEGRAAVIARTDSVED